MPDSDVNRSQDRDCRPPFGGQAEFVPALRSGEWVIEQVMLDEAPRLKVTHRGYLVMPGYFSTIEGVKAALARDGGPDLAEFEPDLS